MQVERLSESNFLLYAAKHYKNVNCIDSEEFFEDILIFRYLRRILNKYKTRSVLNERLILNHIITINNLWGPEHTCKMLFLKLPGYEECLKPFLEYVGIMPTKIEGIYDEIIYAKDIESDIIIESVLEKL